MEAVAPKVPERAQVWPSEESVAAGNKGPDEAESRWSLASVMLSGIQSMGRAVKVSGEVVDRVNSEAQAALAQQRVRGLLLLRPRTVASLPRRSCMLRRNPQRHVRA